MGGVDTFLITASDGTTDSDPGHVDLFISSPQAVQATLVTAYPFNSPDSLTYNPTTGTLFSTESLRQDPADANTTTWVLRELNAADGTLIRNVSESEDNLEGDMAPDIDILPDNPAEGIQGMAVVQGTGTARDGNILLLSTRAQAVIEVDRTTGLQVTAADGGVEFTSEFIFTPDSSVTGIFHTLDDSGQEVLYAVDLRGRGIVQFSKDGTVNEAKTIDLSQAIPEAELQGIVIAPATGNFLLSDDATGNASSIYEVTPDGNVMGVINVLQLGGEDNFGDTEGLGIDPATRTLYVAMDEDLRNPNLDINPIGNQIAVLQLSNPIPRLNLSFLNSVPFESGDGIVFDPATGDLFGLQTVIVDIMTFSFDSDIIRLDSVGDVISSFPFPNSPPTDASGITVLPNGNLLITSAQGQQVAEFTINGVQVIDGINITTLPGFNDGTLIVSTAYDATTDTVLGTNFFGPQILEFDRAGQQVNTIDLSAIFPNGSALQGLAINSITGNFYVADDSGGTSSIYEVTRSGELVSSINLLIEFGTQFSDPEGLSVDPVTNTLYVVFDDDDQNPARHGNIVASFSLGGN